MSEEFLYQLRIYFSSEFSKIYSSDLHNELKGLLQGVLKEYKAELVSQYDGFMGYIIEAEKNGIENYPLYKWTKASMANDTKINKYKNSYTVYINEESVYNKHFADKLEESLRTLVDGYYIIRTSKHDTNPENNPQPPKKYLT